jgi:hypothetical protein
MPQSLPAEKETQAAALAQRVVSVMAPTLRSIIAEGLKKRGARTANMAATIRAEGNQPVATLIHRKTMKSFDREWPAFNEAVVEASKSDDRRVPVIVNVPLSGFQMIGDADVDVIDTIKAVVWFDYVASSRATN